MRVYSSLWNADDWATQGEQVKTDWTKAPFTASKLQRQWALMGAKQVYDIQLLHRLETISTMSPC
ncbi:hypothetical protein RJ639_035352 [Escallonia herrerae]|uniref:GH16 domain-containing protein n=1 Tax=Escallonia herrerae TaxID=1293975 RepID=A0AA88WU26_9ASTE|nr:hypothetical protein RJ639_035352 [Escallonia herrerae]